jgi:hypothetical protein
MHVLSENVLNDTILALGLMICFYYGLTAFACTWYFRDSLFNSVRNFVCGCCAPVLGGVGLFVVFIQTAVDSWAPEFGSGSEIFGVGLVFVLGVGILALGIGVHAGDGPASARLLPRRDPEARTPRPWWSRIAFPLAPAAMPRLPVREVGHRNPSQEAAPTGTPLSPSTVLPYCRHVTSSGRRRLRAGNRNPGRPACTP